MTPMEEVSEELAMDLRFRFEAVAQRLLCGRWIEVVVGVSKAWRDVERESWLM
jgi:hypothetical protein